MRASMLHVPLLAALTACGTFEATDPKIYVGVATATTAFVPCVGFAVPDPILGLEVLDAVTCAPEAGTDRLDVLVDYGDLRLRASRAAFPSPTLQLFRQDRNTEEVTGARPIRMGDHWVSRTIVPLAVESASTRIRVAARVDEQLFIEASEPLDVLPSRLSVTTECSARVSNACALGAGRVSVVVDAPRTLVGRSVALRLYVDDFADPRVLADVTLELIGDRTTASTEIMMPASGTSFSVEATVAALRAQSADQSLASPDASVVVVECEAGTVCRASRGLGRRTARFTGPADLEASEVQFSVVVDGITLPEITRPLTTTEGRRTAELVFEIPRRGDRFYVVARAGRLTRSTDPVTLVDGAFELELDCTPTRCPADASVIRATVRVMEEPVERVVTLRPSLDGAALPTMTVSLAPAPSNFYTGVVELDAPPIPGDVVVVATMADVIGTSEVVTVTAPQLTLQIQECPPELCTLVTSSTVTIEVRTPIGTRAQTAEIGIFADNVERGRTSVRLDREELSERVGTTTVLAPSSAVDAWEIRGFVGRNPLPPRRVRIVGP